MIEPAVTSWPANTFTPSRFAFESRPFFEEPRPFLCAISGLLCGLLGSLLAGSRLLGRADALDRDPRQLAAVAAGLLVARLGLELEHLDLLAAHVLDHLDRHAAGQLRAVDLDRVAAGHQHLGRERSAGVDRLPVDQQGLALLDAVLLSAHFDDCVHIRLQRKRTPASCGPIMRIAKAAHSPSSRPIRPFLARAPASAGGAAAAGWDAGCGADAAGGSLGGSPLAAGSTAAAAAAVVRGFRVRGFRTGFAGASSAAAGCS